MDAATDASDSSGPHALPAALLLQLQVKGAVAIRKLMKSLVASVLAVLASAQPAIAEQIDDKPIEMAFPGQAIRHIAVDMCFPATAEEYLALGKHAIVMVRAASAISTELPLRTVYVLHKDVRIRLERVAIRPMQLDPRTRRAEQVSFYLLPIHLMKMDATLLADFTGERTGFSVYSFREAEGIDADAPAFARLDEYDAPSDPNMASVEEVLIREYPDIFP